MTAYKHHPSIVRKIIVANTLVSIAALLLAGIVFGAYDRASSRSLVVHNLSVQAQLVASNSITAMRLNDRYAAEHVLAALAAAPNVISAAIAGKDGTPFATFDRANEGRRPPMLAIPAGQEEISRFDDREIVLTRRISVQGHDVGIVSIASDYGALNSRRRQYIGLLATVLVLSGAAAFFISWRSQRSISNPIVALAVTANKVSDERDYSVRAMHVGNARELVILTDAFNLMLTQIEQRDRSLRHARSQLETRVQQRTAELDAVNKELEAFSYSVSHDLRAPLRHIAGFTRLLEKRGQNTLDEESRRYLQTITTAAGRMGQLIDDLLDFSRMGRGQLAKQPVNLNDLVRNGQQEATTLADVGNRAIEWHVGQLPEVIADPSMLRLVVLNLLSNALKYSAPRPMARIEIGARTDSADEVVVFVRDNGVGFDMTYAHKLFGVFQRLHSSDEFEGTGIGLANVRRIVHRHGGRVWAESEIDQGATFYFALPLKG